MTMSRLSAAALAWLLVPVQVVNVLVTTDTPLVFFSALSMAAFVLAVRRDSRYLNWKYAEPPHVRYTSALLRRGDDVDGYVVYRHFRDIGEFMTELKDILDQASRQSALDARALAARIRRQLAGRKHSDSVELLAEDRAR